MYNNTNRGDGLHIIMYTGGVEYTYCCTRKYDMCVDHRARAYTHTLYECVRV